MNHLITRKQFIGTALAAGVCGRGMAASRASDGKRAGAPHSTTPTCAEPTRSTTNTG